MAEPKFHRAQCYVCGTFSPWFRTEDESNRAHAWHVYHEHPDVWLRLIGEAREPNVPEPSAAIVAMPKDQGLN